MLKIEPVILKGRRIQLEPLNESHKHELYVAAQDESIWTYFSSKVMGDGFYDWYDSAIQHFHHQEHLPFVVRRLSDNKLIGSSRYYHIDPLHHRLTIGYTWYIPEVWGTYVNTECKLLLLQYAFESLHVNRVEFMIHSANARSRAAVKKLGAVEEGILRHHMILEDGSLRDTVVYSIIQSDWVRIKPMLMVRNEVCDASEKSS